MSGRLLDFDPLTQISSVYHDENDGLGMGIETVQDVTDIVEMNKLLFNDVDERARYGEKLNRVASIPLGVYFDLERRGITKDPVAFKKWMDDPDNRAFRTRPGRLSK